ncbi:MAG: hypothetical protein LBI53_02260 [Candidatus Peribacteria bacterium]|nr:hypothetical protein [Candidatus Peribacteria bacterium]
MEVEAFPQDLPNRIEIDISTLTTINDVVFVRDLKVSSKVEIVDDMELPVLTIAVLFDEVEETTDSMEPTVERTLESTEPTP